MDVEPTSVEAQLLGHAKRQTEALESLRGIALFWTALAILGFVIGLALALRG